jgi:hypothetical protein
MQTSEQERRLNALFSRHVPVADKWPLGPGFRLGRPSRADPSYAR